MNKRLILYSITFIVIVLIQIGVMNNLQFSGYINPYFYVLFILLLPVNIPNYLLLLLGFAMGIVIDVFSNTPGIHASATVFVSFVRPFLFNSYNFDDKEKVLTPTLKNIGFSSFVRYAALMILIHHTFLFFIEVFSFSGFLYTLLRVVLSSIFTFVVILISQFIIFRK